MSLQWETEVRPVLDAVHAVASRTTSPVNGVAHVDIDAELGREAWDTNTAFALRRLAGAGYVRMLHESDNHIGPTYVDLTEKGLQLTAGWPAGAGDGLLASLLEELERRIAGAQTEEERSAMVRFRDFALGVGRDVMVSVLSGYLDRQVRTAGG